MQNSKIEWTDHTFNPWWGCQRVSPGCEYCYAETMAHRYNFRVWGPAKTTGRREMSANYWRQPLRWNDAARRAGTRARVFCASMADVFEDHPAVVAWRQRLWTVVQDTPWLDWLLLTKRPENIKYMLPLAWQDAPRDNVWIGTSVEDQQRANERIPHLLRVPAKVRFLSCEPLLGPLDLDHFLIDDRTRIGDDVHYHDHPALHWVICGGESGPGARPMHPAWARSLRDQCEAARVAFFFKQWGEYAPAPWGKPDPKPALAVRTNGQSVYAQVGHVAGFRAPDEVCMERLGKHASGRLLDNREYNELPA